MLTLPELLHHLGCPPSPAAALNERLLEQYRANALPYHNLTHIESTVQLAYCWRRLVDDVTPILLALWFHDAIYDPQQADNEAQSAALMKTWVTPLIAPPAVVDQAAELILATRHHTPANSAEGLVVDADLAILGAPPDGYAAYARAIRQEYAWVPDEQYRHGRRQVLTRFLAKSTIFYHPPLAAAFEQQARLNLAWELKQLPPS